MCGIVGLHLRNPELHPRLGELLTGMLCEMSDRGSDSAGVAVYGDPAWTPPGHGCVSLLDIAASPESVTDAVGSALGVPVSVTVLDATYLVTAQAVDLDQAGDGRVRRSAMRWSPASVRTWRCSRASGTRTR